MNLRDRLQLAPCPRRDKIAYPSLVLAQFAASVVSDWDSSGEPRPQEPYVCDCGLWHLRNTAKSREQQAEIARKSKARLNAYYRENNRTGINRDNIDLFNNTPKGT